MGATLSGTSVQPRRFVDLVEHHGENEDCIEMPEWWQPGYEKAWRFGTARSTALISPWKDATLITAGLTTGEEVPA
jgi:hypothetical protein